jgi:methionyl-tRNA formyltransferase
LLALPVLGCVNFHNGLLERYRGVNVPSWALFNGEAEHGVSWHTMERSIDTGAVLASARFPLDGTETALSLTIDCIDKGIDLFQTRLESLLGPAGGERPDTSAARVCRRSDRPNDGWLDPRWPVAAIDRMLRATDFRPYPNTFTYAKLRVGGGELIVNEARAVAANSSGEPGALRVDNDRLLLSCADAELELTGVMLEPDVEVPVAAAIEALGLAPGRAVRVGH